MSAWEHVGREAPRSARLRPAAGVAPSGGVAGRMLGLQRLAGNQAVSGALRSGVPTVQRACCGGCASGGTCESDDDRAPSGGGAPVQRLEEVADQP